ncbi:MAG: EAL domain-containing protein [Gammaproteobacteria bacterium]|nr:EAL domain-containing protein [Gammaproteobacteria bacterium]
MAESSRNRVEELGKQFLRALDPLRVQSLAMIDGEADVLWLSAGAMGPDEHALVGKSLDTFTVDRERAVIDRRLEDHRRAIFFAARDPFGTCCGLVLALVEARSASDAPLSVGAHLQALLRRFSALLAPPLPQKGASEPEPAAATGGATAAGAIHARKYLRLQGGGTTRHYEIAAGNASENDLGTIERVATWLARNRDRHDQQPAVFTVLVGAAAVEDAAFIAHVKTLVQRQQLERGRLGLGLPGTVWRESAATVGRFLAECAGLGCSVLLDDYTLRHDAVALLRFPAVRCLKVDAQLTAHAMSDRVAHAELAAIVQAARVLGLHCVAKNVASQAAAKWLAALGVDFADRVSGERPAGSSTRTGEALTLERVG